MGEGVVDFLGDPLTFLQLSGLTFAGGQLVSSHDQVLDQLAVSHRLIVQHVIDPVGHHRHHRAEYRSNHPGDLHSPGGQVLGSNGDR